jgi:hypothetical protein
MLSKDLLDMVRDTFTKYGDFVPELHLRTVLAICKSLVSDPNQSATDNISNVALHYAAAGQIASYWSGYLKFSESRANTVRAASATEIRRQAALNKEKLTVDAISTMVTLDEKVVAAQYSVDVGYELSQSSKSLASAISKQHETLIEQTRSERAENKINH